MEDTYTVEAAATLLGVSPERIQSLVKQNAIDTTEDGGETVLTKKAISILFDNISDDPISTEVEIERPKNLTPEAERRIEEVKVSNGAIVVEEPELIELFEELDKHVNRVNHLTNMCRRLEQKVKSHKKQAMGHDAELRDLAAAYHPALIGKDFDTERLDDGTIIFRFDPNSRGGGGGDGFQKRFSDVIGEAVQRGLIPPGLFGPGGHRGGDGDEY